MFDLGNEKLNLKEGPTVMESHQQIRWSLLFVDLMYVGVIYNCDAILLSCGHEPIVFYIAFCYFSLMFNTRLHLDFYASSSICLLKNTWFPLLQNDVFHRTVVVLFGLGVYLSTINIGEDIHSSDENGDFGYCDFNRDYTSGFSIGFIISRSTIVIWNAVIVFFSPLQTFRELYFYSFCSRSAVAFLTIVIMIAPFYNPSNVVVCMPLVIAIDLFSDHLRAGVAHLFGIQHRSDIEVITPHHAHQDTIFCNPEMFLERIGLLFMLVIGEGIIGISFTRYTGESPGTWRSQIFVYLLFISTAMLFYETVDRVNFDNHALVKGLHLRVAFYLMHLIASMFLLVAVVGVIELYVDAGNALPSGFTTDDHGDTHSVDVQWYSWLISIGLFGMEVSLEIMRYLHEPEFFFETYDLADSRSYLRLVFRLAGAIHLVIYWIAQAAGSYSDLIIMAHAIVSLSANIINVITATLETRNKGSDLTGKDAEVGSHGRHSKTMFGRFSTILSWDDRRTSVMNRPSTADVNVRKSITQNPLQKSTQLTAVDPNSNKFTVGPRVSFHESITGGRKPGTLLSAVEVLESTLPPIEEETASGTASVRSSISTRVDSVAGLPVVAPIAPYSLMKN